MLTLAQIAALLNVAPPPGADQVQIAGAGTLAEAGPTQISFLGDKRFVKHFATTRAGAVIVQAKIDIPPDAARPVLRVDNADLAMAKVLEAFAPPIARPAPGVHPSAQVDPTAVIADGVRIGPNVFVGARATVGARTVLHPGVCVGDDTLLGDDVELFPNVVVRERCTLGNRVVVHAGSVIGSDGFGYRWDGSKHAKLPQIGTVVIEDDVEIGSCTCVDRAKFSETRVGRGSKIDNLVQVAHNVVMGPHCIVAGQAGMAGSVTMGAGVMLGGQCAVRDHVHMADGSMLAACSGAMDDVAPKQFVSGLPAIPHRQMLREQAALRHVPELRAEIKKLQDELAEIRKRLPS
ncbi:MAG: UDP-3-O-(3-hydroxymyristoyl)glucosamine N-acyltransferase [Phycisphaerae bacterium]